MLGSVFGWVGGAHKPHHTTASHSTSCCHVVDSSDMCCCCCRVELTSQLSTALPTAYAITQQTHNKHQQTGYYDIQSRRYVLVWLATAPAQDAEPLLFVAVSVSNDPLGQWSVKALKIRPSATTFKCGGGGHGHGSGEPFFANYPQVGGGGIEGGNKGRRDCPHDADEILVLASQLLTLTTSRR